MPSATTRPPRTFQPESRFLLTGVGWRGYELMLEIVGDRPIRLTYDRGNLELMSPSIDHERFRVLLGRFIEAVALALDIPCEPVGSPTWRREDVDRGLEPDQCYYIAHADRVAGRGADLLRDGPPDLAVEIDISPSRLDRPGVYAALGIPELWRYDGETFRMERLGPGGNYGPCEASPNLPFLTPVDVTPWLDRANEVGQNAWIREIHAWALAELAPRLGRD